MNEKRLLIVDDEDGIRENLSILLEDEAEVIMTAKDGQDALEIYEKKKPFDCIICDINMPRMNGIEFIKAVREKEDNVTVIFFTAYGTKGLMFEAVKYGAFDFISKPDFDNLSSIVRSAINYEEEATTEDEALNEYKKLLEKK